MTTPSTPVGVVEIADRTGVKPITVRKWAERHAAFPASRWRVSGNPAWDWDEVRNWLRDTERLRELARADLIDAGWTIDPPRGTGDWAGCEFISRPASDDPAVRVKLIVTPESADHWYGWILTEHTGGHWGASAQRYAGSDVVGLADSLASKVSSDDLVPESWL